jgi:nucleotide-binding universal stress UspA family protein
VHHIVVAVDGSAVSQEALSHAIAVARQSEAALTGVFIIDDQWADYIGNDWQSAKGARQGFLDYVQKEQQEQAQAAREQFEEAVGNLPRANFALQAGDPTQVLLDIARDDTTDLLVLNRRVFQVSGRPSLKGLAARIAEKALRPFVIFP